MLLCWTVSSTVVKRLGKRLGIEENTAARIEEHERSMGEEEDSGKGHWDADFTLKGRRG